MGRKGKPSRVTFCNAHRHRDGKTARRIKQQKKQMLEKNPHLKETDLSDELLSRKIIFVKEAF